MRTITVKKSDLRKVVEYLYEGEEKHYEESGKKQGHIFQAVRRLQKNLDDHDKRLS